MTPEEAIAELLFRAFKYDDKRHRLYSHIAQMARLFEPDEGLRNEIIRLMDIEYRRDPHKPLKKKKKKERK